MWRSWRLDNRATKMTAVQVAPICFLLLVVGTNFLPGLQAHPTNEEYEIIQESSDGNSLETDHSRISYNIVPLYDKLNREKRQVFRNSEEAAPADKSVLNKQGTTGKKPIEPVLKQTPSVWLNLTRKASGETAEKALQPAEPTSSSTNRLLGVDKNQFVNNNNTTGEASNSSETKGTPVSTDQDSYYPDLPLEPDLSFDHAKDNDTINAYNVSSVVQRDEFKYYTTHYYPEGSGYWVDMNESSIVHGVLSDAHRRAATLKPKFEFPFYGHPITNVTVATGGFIYLGEQVHAWLAATQYVAPLMANFESSASDEDLVSYLTTDELFSVEWRKLRLQDHPDLGNFTFQTTLYKNGTIVFVYESIPVAVTKINDTNHPVKVGLSDAYIKDRGAFIIKQKTIYEYDRIDLKEHYDFELANGSAIIFTPVPTCQNFTECESCVTADSKFECVWCPKLKRCSDGWDRKRQDWVQNQCDKDNVQVNIKSKCAASAIIYNINSTPSTMHDGHDESGHPDSEQDHYSSSNSPVKREKAHDEGGTGAGGVLAIMFFVIAVFAAVGWLVYAYMYPHTPSGQMLIRYRPSQWAFRRGEARYTAASIHM